MDAYERWQALRSGDRPDRPPVAFWRHFYDRENDPKALAEATIEFQRCLGWDLVKVNPRASYHTEPWGVKVECSTDPLRKPIKKSWPIHNANDLKKIQPIPATCPEFDDQLRALALIRRALPRPLPVVMTMFTPLSVLGDLVPEDGVLMRLLNEAPEAVEAALENLTQTFCVLAVEFLNAGADGLFFATTEWASQDRLRVEQYRKYGRPYDLRVLNAIAGDATSTVLHVCGPNVPLEEFSGYPVDVLNWDATDPTNPSLRDGGEALNKPVLGGIDGNGDLLELPPAALVDKTRRLVEAHADLPFAVGPGCAIPVQVSPQVLHAVKRAVEEIAQRR